MSYRRTAYDDSRIGRSSYETSRGGYGTGIGDRYSSRTDFDLDRSRTVVVDHDFKADCLKLEGRVNQLERENRLLQEQEQHTRQYREQLTELERDVQKASSDVVALQHENRQLREQLRDQQMEYESHLRRNTEQSAMSNHHALTVEKNYEDLRLALSRHLFPESYGDARSHETLLRKLEEYISDYRSERGHNVKLSSNIKSAENELRQLRERNERLNEQLESTNKYVASTNVMKEERDAAVRRQKQLEDEKKRLEEDLRKAYELSDGKEHELRVHRQELGMREADTRKNALSYQAAVQEQKAFKDSIAALLSDGYTVVQANDEAIKQKIRDLQGNRFSEEKSATTYKAEIKKLMDELQNQAELNKSANQKKKKLEEERDELKEKLKAAKGELQAADLLQGGLKTDRHKHKLLLEKLAEVMKVDCIANELGLELNGDMILTRAAQLVEDEQLHGQRNGPQSIMQRQVKDLKQAVQQKDIRIDLLCKKLSALEAEVKDHAEHNWDDLADKNKEMTKQLHKKEKQLTEARRTIEAMKAESIENQTLKITTEEQRRALELKERQLLELEQVRSRQAKRIAGLKHEKDSTEFEATHGLKVTESTIQSLSNEVQRLKQRLDDSTKREKQLLDLRHVLARMMGLDCDKLAVPDYEIISRLEKLIESQHEFAIQARHLNVAGAGGDDVMGMRKSLSGGNIRQVSAARNRTALTATTGRLGKKFY